MNTNEEFIVEPSIESQNGKIREWLHEGKAITAIEALNLWGCFRLASRISDLRHKFGENIVREMIVTPSGKRVAQYRMAV